MVLTGKYLEVQDEDGVGMWIFGELGVAEIDIFSVWSYRMPRNKPHQGHQDS